MMKIKKTRAKLGAKNQHESLIVHHEETAHGKDFLPTLHRLAEETAWQSNPVEILRRYVEGVTAFLTEKGLPTEWKSTETKFLYVAEQVEEETRHPETRPKGHRGLVAAGKCLDLYKDALMSAERGDYKAALLGVLKAIPNEKLAVVGDMEPRWHAGCARVGEGAAEKQKKTAELKERAWPEWERLIREGKSKKNAGEIIAKMRDETGEPLAGGRKGGTITDWFEHEN